MATEVLRRSADVVAGADAGNSRSEAAYRSSSSFAVGRK